MKNDQAYSDAARSRLFDDIWIQSDMSGIFDEAGSFIPIIRVVTVLTSDKVVLRHFKNNDIWALGVNTI